MNKLLLVSLGIFFSAVAQIMLKKSSSFAFMKDYYFYVYFFSGALSYLFSFGIYTYVLKIFNLSKISPVMTIGTMLLVVISGILFFRETVTIKQFLGVTLGLVSIMLLVK